MARKISIQRFMEASILVIIVIIIVHLWQLNHETGKSAPVPALISNGPKPVELNHEVESPKLTTWEPRPTARLPFKLLTYPHFTIGYDEAAKNPAWVSYRLAGPITYHGSEKRPSTFATDFGTVAHVSYSDYSNSGFDRGHMVPAYALFSRFGDEGLKQTFVMSNVIPQYHGLNAGEWEQVEELVAGRSGKGDGWAGKYNGVWVVNGPIYEKRPASDQLRNGTWIPTSCFSVVLRQTDGHWDSLAVIIPNTKTVAGPVGRYLTMVSTINRETSLDLLAGMEEAEKEQVEKQRALELWR